MPFPTEFARTLSEVPQALSPDGIRAASELADQGYVVRAGMMPDYVSQIAIMGSQPDIRDQCPKDATESRFYSVASTRQWLQKGAPEIGYGRQVFLLMKAAGCKGLQLAGYGWTGPEVPVAPKDTSPELVDEFRASMAGLTTTFAIRIGRQDAGQGLAAPFTRVVVDATRILAGAQNMWLETAASNHAGRAYKRAGWQQLGIAIPYQRPSSTAGHPVSDIRHYYKFPNELLLGAQVA